MAIERRGDFIKREVIREVFKQKLELEHGLLSFCGGKSLMSMLTRMQSCCSNERRRTETHFKARLVHIALCSYSPWSKQTTWLPPHPQGGRGPFCLQRNILTHNTAYQIVNTNRMIMGKGNEILRDGVVEGIEPRWHYEEKGNIVVEGTKGGSMGERWVRGRIYIKTHEETCSFV